MADIKESEALIHGRGYNSVDEIWSDEIGNASAIKLADQIMIQYSFLLGTPLYYADNNEPESAAFDPILSGSNLEGAIRLLLGDSSQNQSFNSFFPMWLRLFFLKNYSHPRHRVMLELYRL